MADAPPQLALSDVAARQLANATKTPPQMSTITPRWLTHLLPWVPVEAGIYRLNKVKDASRVTVACSRRDERDLPETFVDYDENPREYMLSAVTTIVDVHTRVSDLYSVPHDQIGEQLRLAIETIKERQESELLNNKEYGLLTNASPRHADQDPQRPADARRHGRADRPRLERTGVLPGPSAGDRRVRPRVHPPRRAAGDGNDVRFAIHHVARIADLPLRQARHRRGQDEHRADADRRVAPGRDWTLPARSAPVSRAWGFPFASWASVARRSHLTSCRSIARPSS